jgi:hypothetical protein
VYPEGHFTLNKKQALADGKTEIIKWETGKQRNNKGRSDGK